mmetsp:Transcript_2261/g.3642  ORF Transcript_2261/g.3642 Transcript_2261/m.3642 type:complete len:216 (+) Transcript_2261:40-687(+)
MNIGSQSQDIEGGTICGETICAFGKHQGEKFLDICRNDQEYVDYVLLEEEPFLLSFGYFQQYLIQEFEKGRLEMSFGKYRGTQYRDVYDWDRGYVEWVLSEGGEALAQGFLLFREYCKRRMSPWHKRSIVPSRAVTLEPVQGPDIVWTLDPSVETFPCSSDDEEQEAEMQQTKDMGQEVAKAEGNVALGKSTPLFIMNLRSNDLQLRGGRRVMRD